MVAEDEWVGEFGFAFGLWGVVPDGEMKIVLVRRSPWRVLNLSMRFSRVRMASRMYQISDSGKKSYWGWLEGLEREFGFKGKNGLREKWVKGIFCKGIFA